MYKYFLITVVFLCGCVSSQRQINTQLTKLNIKPTFSGAKLDFENLRVFVSGAPNSGSVGVGGAISPSTGAVSPVLVGVSGDPKISQFIANSEGEKQLYDILKVLSKNKISSSANADLVIEDLRVNIQYPQQDVTRDVALGSASFFVPTLGNVKTERVANYSAKLTFRKSKNESVSEHLTGSFSGDFKGSYIKGQKQGMVLSKELLNYSLQDLAIKIVNILNEQN